MDSFGTTQQSIGGYNYTDHRAWSQSPPGGLTASQVPMFVVFGFDDNPRSGLNTTPASGVTWVTNYFKTLRNPAGSGNAATFDNALCRVAFYSNATYIDNTGYVEDPVLVKRSWNTAIVDGHETGNHTYSHPDGGAGNFTVQQWTDEINKDNDWLTRAFVPNEASFSVGSGPGASLINIIGFRTPYLSYNTNTFQTLHNIGFTYDVSVEDGWQLSDDGTNMNWPYTLDSGSPGGTAVGRPTGNQSGLWELGAQPFVMPQSLRTQTGLTKITGLDYNMFVSANLSGPDVLTILKYDLDQRLASNRAPFLVGAHTNIYTDAVSLTNSTAATRRAAIEQFITYALSKPQVRIVTPKDLITWLRNPVALGSCTAETNAAFCSRLGKNCGSVTANDNCGTSRTVSSCGTCTSPATCGGGGTANVCGTCTAESNTAFCSRLGKNCGSVTANDNCGTSRTVSSCGTCTSPATCGGGGTANVCGTSCTAETNAAFCSRLGKNCGSVTANDNCGTSRTVSSCGTCTSPATCGGGGTANVCGTCTAETNAAFCSRLGKNCGSVTANDNCGTSRTVSSCGTCTSPATCGGGGTANVCGGGGAACAPAYSNGNCLAYQQGQQVSSGGHNWTCSNANCRNCATYTSCAPGGTGCPWGVVWTDNGACQ
jgi:peptidoglycan/xylan/chitin deacetylase (PgdA/CDA1 family)